MNASDFTQDARSEFAAMPGSANFPGYCIDMFEGSVWLTKEGKITPNYDDRGIWMTLPEAEAALEAANAGNDPKLSDGGGWRGPCMAGGKVAAEARGVTAGAVRCSAWLGVAVELEIVENLLSLLFILGA